MKQHDLVVIGAGPGGYTAAIRAAQLGLNVACIDKEAELGGTCLRIGCIPSKALLESSEVYWAAKGPLNEHGIEIGHVKLDLPKMLARKQQIVKTLTGGVDGLFKKHGITAYTGQARFSGANTLAVKSSDGEQEVSGKHILIATGSVPASLPGVELDGDRIGTSTEALSYTEVPGKLVVIGAGYIGLEMAAVWHRLGSEVTLLEYLDRILPGTDVELANESLKLFKRQGLDFRLGSRVTGARVKKNHCIVEYEGAKPLECDRVLVAVGRKPLTESLGLDAANIKVDQKGFIQVDETYQTSTAGVYAVGDVIGGPMLAHKAEEEGVACVEHIVTGFGHVNYDAIPSVVYTHPEIASVGKTEEQLKESGIEYRKGKFPFRANGRARALGELDGFVKILADKSTDRILGVHILGARASELIAEATVSIAFGASSEDVARCSHAHPTLAEIVREAALAVDGRPINI